MTVLITDPDLLTQNTEVTVDTDAKTIQLEIAGNLGNEGVTLQALYSFLKEEWKADANLIKFPFPMLAITEEKFEIINGWDFKDTTTRQLIRTGGWGLNPAGTVVEEYAGIITLGSLGDTDQVYFQQVGSGATANIALPGVVNQAVKIYGDGSHGSVNYRSYFKLFVREYAKSYGMAQLSDIGVGTMTYQVYRFPLTNATDLKIVATDANVIGKAPYFGTSTASGTDGVAVAGDETFTSAAAAFAVGDVGKFICIESGTNMGFYKIVTRNSATSVELDRVMPANGSSIAYTVCPGAMKLTWYAAAQTKTGFNFGDANFHLIIEGNQGSAEQIYTFAQYMLRQNRDIDDGAGTQTGKTVNALLQFTGDALATLPYDTGKGTFINDFKSSDTNRLSFSDSAVTTTKRARDGSNTATITTATAHGLVPGDAVTISGVGGTGYNGAGVVGTTPTPTSFTYANTGTLETETADTAGTVYDRNYRTYPYVAALTLNFGDNLKNDAAAKYWVFFTDDNAGVNLGHDFGTADAIIAKTQAGVDMTGDVSAASSVQLTYDYDGNVQRGAGSAGQDAPITVVALGLTTGQYVSATGTIARSTANVVSLVAALERNYSNPA